MLELKEQQSPQQNEETPPIHLPLHRTASKTFERWSLAATRALSISQSTEEGDDVIKEVMPETIPCQRKVLADTGRMNRVCRRRLSQKLLEDVNLKKFDAWDPELSVKFLSVTSLPNYSCFRKLIENAKPSWMEDFLARDGLAILFDKLEKLSTGYSISNATFQLEVAYSIRAVLNSKVGLEYLLTQRQFTRQLINAMGTKNTLVKKLVLELFSAVSVYSSYGHKAALDALDYFKMSRTKMYRCAILVSEIIAADLIEYKTAILCFINCLILGTEEIWTRHSIRSEVIGLGILESIESLKTTENQELMIQIQVFEYHRTKDEDSLEVEEEKGLFDLFSDFFTKIRDKPQALSLHQVLSNVLQINVSDPVNYRLWNILEKVTKDASMGSLPEWKKFETYSTYPDFHVEMVSVNTQTDDDISSCSILASEEGDSRLDGSFRSESTFSEIPTPPPLPFGSNTPHPPQLHWNTGSFPNISAPPPPPLPSSGPLCSSSPFSSQPLISTNLESQLIFPNGPSDIPPPPPLPGVIGSLPPVPPPLPGSIGFLPPVPPPLPNIPPPPPPPFPSLGSLPPLPPPLPSIGCLPPPPPPLPCLGPSYPVGSSGVPPPPPPPSTGVGFQPPPPPPPGISFSATDSATKLIKPTTKLKTLNWTKVTQVGADSIWKEINETIRVKPPVSLRLHQIEELFCLKPNTLSSTTKGGIKGLNREITPSLLDSKRSLAVNIFLKQFKCTAEEIVDRIARCDSSFFTTEHLSCLQKILPEPDEISTLKSYKGDATKLGPAEQFLLRLLALSGYSIRIKATVMKMDFHPSMSELEPPLRLILNTCHDLVTNKSLQDFMAVILQLGNYLNSNSYAGNAVGFKLSALQQLTDLRANKPRMTLLHYIVDISMNENPTLLDFTVQLASVKEARKLSLETIATELRGWKSKVDQLQKQLLNSEADVATLMNDFLVEAMEKVLALEQVLLEIESSVRTLAIHFSEDPAKMKLSDCFNAFSDLIVKTEMARKENEMRKVQEERIARLAAEKALLAASPSKTKSGSSKKGADDSKSPEGDDVCIVDRLLADIRRGEFKLKKSTRG